MGNEIKYILFDAANTLIHKPDLWPSMQAVFEKYGHFLDSEKLKYHHKLISEVVNFPDRTSQEFYNSFNAEFLMSFGIPPSEEILADLFAACSYLPWQSFQDTKWLNECKIPVGVLSNFNNTLPGILEKLFGNIFTNIIVSEKAEVRKPDTAFYQLSLNIIGLPAKEILYIGDSIKLDMLPANNIGLNTCLIDRLDIYKNSSFNRVINLEEITFLV